MEISLAGDHIKPEKPLTNEEILWCARSKYRDARFQPRLCDRDGCGTLYRGPAIYCSLKCALLDA